MRGQDYPLGLLLDNDFHRLGVSVRDPVAKIVDAAANPLIAVASEAAERARFTLTNPRARLRAEVAWLPGVSPNRAAQLLEMLRSGIGAEGGAEGLPATARANFLISRLTLRPVPQDVEAATAQLAVALNAIAAIAPSDLLREINEDRSVAAIPPVRAEEVLAEALDQQRRVYNSALRSFLNRLPTDVLVEGITQVTEEATDNGRKHGGEALEALLDAYEAEALVFLEPEAARIRELCDAILEHGGKGDMHLQPAIGRLNGLLMGWDRVAQPLQLIGRARGQPHGLSRDLARHVRGVAVDLANQHQGIQSAAEITNILARVFAELSDMREVFVDDGEALADIELDLQRRQEINTTLAYSARVGLGKTLLSISADEVIWGSQRFAADKVAWVSWGATSRSINGIPTGTTYRIGFSDGAEACDISTRSKEVFHQFTDRLWRACGARIAVSLLRELRGGKVERIGGISFNDTGVRLAKSKLLGKPEHQTFSWSDVKVWSEGGQYIVAAKADARFRADASYQDHANTHVLANVVSSAFSRGYVQLSQLLH
jgi:hypothetical protein